MTETSSPKEENKRDRILAAATKVLAHKGFHHTKIRDIAQEASVADGTIYLYFKNKEHLLIELFEDVMKKVLHIFDKALEGTTTTEEKLTKFVYTQVKMVRENTELARIITIVLRQSATFLEEYKNPLFGKYLQKFYKILEEGVEQGVFRNDVQLAIINRAVFGALDELALAWLLSTKKDIDLEDSADTITKILLHGLSAPSTKS